MCLAMNERVPAEKVDLEDSKRVLEVALWAVGGIMKPRPGLGPLSESQRIRADLAIQEIIEEVLGPDDGG